MKKKYLAILLAAVMMSCSGCAVTDVLNNFNSAEEDADDDDDSSDDEEDSQGGDEDTDDGNTVDETQVTNGPAFVVLKYTNDYYYENLTMDVSCETVQLLTPGFDKLQGSIDELYSHNYDETLGRWDYDMLDYYGAEEFGNEFAASGFGHAHWNYDCFVTVARNDSQLFSIDVSTNSYTGGAHDFTEYNSYNFAPATGEFLKLADVVNDYDALYDRVYSLLLEEYDTTGMFYEEWETTLHDKFYYESYFVEGMDKSWSAKEDGITVFFNGYELAPWMLGEVSVDVTLDNASEILKPEYFHKAGDVKVVYEAPDNGQTEFSKTILRDLIAGIGEWKYDKCITYLEEHNYAYECDEPYESETSGDIWVVDPDTGKRTHLGFWPLDDTLDTYGMEYDALDEISYGIADYTVLFDNYYNKMDTRYRIVDGNTYEVVWFENQEDLWNYLGYLMSK